MRFCRALICFLFTFYLMLPTNCLGKYSRLMLYFSVIHMPYPLIWILSNGIKGYSFLSLFLNKFRIRFTCTETQCTFGMTVLPSSCSNFYFCRIPLFFLNTYFAPLSFPECYTLPQPLLYYFHGIYYAISSTNLNFIF